MAVLWPKHHDKRLPFADEDLREVPVGEHHAVLDAAVQQLEEYFEGARQSFDVPLDLRGSDFQVAVCLFPNILCMRSDTKNHGCSIYVLGNHQRLTVCAFGQGPQLVIVMSSNILALGGGCSYVVLGAAPCSLATGSGSARVQPPGAERFGCHLPFWLQSCTHRHGSS